MIKTSLDRLSALLPPVGTPLKGDAAGAAPGPGADITDKPSSQLPHDADEEKPVPPDSEVVSGGEPPEEQGPEQRIKRLQAAMRDGTLGFGFSAGGFVYP